MADEVADALYESIKKELEREIGSDERIQTILKRIAKGTATHKDTQEYALRLGKLTSKALQNNLTEDTLPDENLSYHIANSTVGKTLEDNLSRVNGVGGQIQNLLNDKAGLGLRAVGATLNYERVHDLVSLMDNCDDLPQARELMDEPVINCTQSYADDVVKENAEFQYQAGLSPQIVRTAEAGCCNWCESLAGTYDYPLATNDIYRRHQYCRCLVTYDPGTGKVQDVYTKKWTYSPKVDKIEERRQIGLRSLDSFNSKQYENTISSYVSLSKETVVSDAQNGGRNRGVAYSAQQKTNSQLEKSIVSHTSQVERHADKIANPEQYVADWTDRDPRYQEGLIQKWEHDMQRNAEQATIELAELEKRRM